MSGHVFHPGHEELHGITVVIEGPDGPSHVGRYHEANDRGIVMHDVAVFRDGAAPSRESWIKRQLQFGVAIDQKHLIVPSGAVSRIVRLADWPNP
jgi:hypothetical protein